ncbi:MAG: ERCC4 domain-containing protein, partial [Thermodesulfobacteriota bacterium]
MSQAGSRGEPGAGKDLRDGKGRDDPMDGFDPTREGIEDVLGWDRRIRIQVDYREKPSGVLAALEVHDVELKIRSLRVGDYIVNDFATIERKAARDFLVSVIDGRLFAQAARMRRHCDNPIFLIEGDLFKTGLDFDPIAVKGSLISLCAIWRIPVLFSDSIHESAQILIMLGKQERKCTSHLSLRKGYRPRKLGSRQLFVLQGLPLVGPQMARRLLKHFGTVLRVMTASENELLQV